MTHDSAVRGARRKDAPSQGQKHHAEKRPAHGTDLARKLKGTALLAGNLITETLFNFKGLGLLFYTALQNVDYNVLLAYTLLGAVLTIIGNLVADIALTIADPRIRLV